MKVEYITKEKPKLLFGELEAGDTFSKVDAGLPVYLKMTSTEGNLALDLETGEPYAFAADLVVRRVHAVITILQ